MDIDLKPFFKKYEDLSSMADKVFEKVKKEFPECVKCKAECSDCCHALFDLTLIEALCISFHFYKNYKGEKRTKLIDKASRADRKIYKLKKKAYKDLESGKNETEILMEMAKEKVRCPLLNSNDMCDLYHNRPITCRLYGIPTSIRGIGHTCGISGFKEGQSYPTVNLDKIQTKLYEISDELAQALKTKYSKLGEMLVPLSMAILTEYSEEYLGVNTQEDETVGEKK
ncbi:hypothetical protein BuS5_03435 [Desulfosarcina sp. BuS5]|uniref:YkgJ family cysteine cluster protein n=1 Tax=Desulfosarcina sp. BuS5 TaxID=933262 RepID=UPI000485CB61|nr:YkgJ family cysteine cluster protein [Desulfosarcina sp. BuS5]WDN90464.1 hypothetical protein BuS5_03435 [Desulfosarcina sp. BuS5]